jgi:hypothetical protein
MFGFHTLVHTPDATASKLMNGQFNLFRHILNEQHTNVTVFG